MLSYMISIMLKERKEDEVRYTFVKSHLGKYNNIEQLKKLNNVKRKQSNKCKKIKQHKIT